MSKKTVGERLLGIKYQPGNNEKLQNMLEAFGKLIDRVDSLETGKTKELSFSKSEFTFESAFAGARAELGPGRVFKWGRELYNTNLKGEDFTVYTQKEMEQSIKNRTIAELVAAASLIKIVLNKRII